MDILDLDHHDFQTESKRDQCGICTRPLGACFCSTFPRNVLGRRDLPLLNRIIVFQHPNEEEQALASVRVLQLCCDPDLLVGIRTRNPTAKFIQSRIPGFSEECRCVVLYPTKHALTLIGSPRRLPETS